MAVKASATITLTSYRDTQSVTRYYKLQPAGSSAPLKPETKPPSSDWTDSEPACDISKELYFCDLTIFSNGEGEYSKVSKSTSYEAAKEAYNKAQSAQLSIDDVTDNIYAPGSTLLDGSKINDGSLSINQMDDTVAGTYSDPTTKRGTMEWKDDALHIKSVDANAQNTYETVVGGDGIKFNWNGVETASINQDELRINKTVVINAMEVGNWSWTIHPTTGNLMVKWNGGE